MSSSGGNKRIEGYTCLGLVMYCAKRYGNLLQYQIEIFRLPALQKHCTKSVTQPFWCPLIETAPVDVGPNVFTVILMKAAVFLGSSWPTFLMRSLPLSSGQSKRMLFRCWRFGRAYCFHVQEGLRRRTARYRRFGRGYCLHLQGSLRRMLFSCCRFGQSYCLHVQGGLRRITILCQSFGQAYCLHLQGSLRRMLFSCWRFGRAYCFHVQGGLRWMTVRCRRFGQAYCLHIQSSLRRISCWEVRFLHNATSNNTPSSKSLPTFKSWWLPHLIQQ